MATSSVRTPPQGGRRPGTAAPSPGSAHQGGPGGPVRWEEPEGPSEKASVLLSCLSLDWPSPGPGAGATSSLHCPSQLATRDVSRKEGAWVGPGPSPGLPVPSPLDRDSPARPSRGCRGGGAGGLQGGDAGKPACLPPTRGPAPLLCVSGPVPRCQGPRPARLDTKPQLSAFLAWDPGWSGAGCLGKPFPREGSGDLVSSPSPSLLSLLLSFFVHMSLATTRCHALPRPRLTGWVFLSGPPSCVPGSSRRHPDSRNTAAAFGAPPPGPPRALEVIRPLRAGSPRQGV